MPKIYANWSAGEGISDKDESGFDVTQNLDAHKNLGTLTTQYDLKLDNSTINEPCYQVQDTSGNIYFFSASSGQVWFRRVSDGQISIVHTNGYGAHYSAIYYNDAIYYTTRDNVGQYDFTTWTDSFGTLSNGAMYHPMEVVNNILHIGDGKDISSINDLGNFNHSALDVESIQSVTALANENSYLLSGTTVASNFVNAKAYYWDTYSSSWTIEDGVISVCFFIKNDNDLFMVANPQDGSTGVIYFWNGNKFESFRPIRNSTVDINVQATANLGRKTLFAVGSEIYSLYKPDGGKYGLIREYTAGSTIQSIMVSGNTLYVSTQTGIYVTDTNNRATGKITTPFYPGSFTRIEVLYQTLNGATLGLETNINNAGWVTESGFINDEPNNKYLLVGGITYDGMVNFGQCRITLNSVSNQAPVISALYVG